MDTTCFNICYCQPFNSPNLIDLTWEEKPKTEKKKKTSWMVILIVIFAIKLLQAPLCD